MSIIRKVSSEKPGIFDRYIIEICQYEDDIYMLCNTYKNGERVIYKYNQYAGMKEIHRSMLSVGTRLHLKKNTNSPPELLYIERNTCLRIVIRNMYTNAQITAANLHVSSVFNNYECSDNVLLISPCNMGNLMIYNIERGTLVNYSYSKYTFHSNVYYDTKFYFMNDEGNTRNLMSVDFTTGDLTKLNGFPIEKDDEFYVCHTFMIDNILHCDIDEDQRICFDVKSGRQFILTGTIKTLAWATINKKGNKMLTFDGNKIREYDIIIGTLFKSALTHEKYHDISIITKNNEE